LRKKYLPDDDVFTNAATVNQVLKIVPGTFMCSHLAECLWKKGLAFKESQFFLQVEIRRRKEFFSA
jgi:hypothetical protein